MIYDKNNKYLRSFVINHKNTINAIYLVMLLCGEQTFREIVFSWGVSEIKCIILKENNDNPYEIHNNYIELSIVFHPMIIIFRK
jgi:hypothetical protein